MSDFDAYEFANIEASRMSANPIKRFTLPDSASDGAGVDFVQIHRSAHRGGDYNLALIGYGFEASRYLTRDEMEQLRDWIVIALANEAAS